MVPGRTGRSYSRSYIIERGGDGGVCVIAHANGGSRSPAGSYISSWYVPHYPITWWNQADRPRKPISPPKNESGNNAAVLPPFPYKSTDGDRAPVVLS